MKLKLKTIVLTVVSLLIMSSMQAKAICIDPTAIAIGAITTTAHALVEGDVINKSRSEPKPMSEFALGTDESHEVVAAVASVEAEGTVDIPELSPTDLKKLLAGESVRVVDEGDQSTIYFVTRDDKTGQIICTKTLETTTEETTIQETINLTDDATTDEGVADSDDWEWSLIQEESELVDEGTANEEGDFNDDNTIVVTEEESETIKDNVIDNTDITTDDDTEIVEDNTETTDVTTEDVISDNTEDNSTTDEKEVDDIHEEISDSALATPEMLFDLLAELGASELVDEGTANQEDVGNGTENAESNVADNHDTTAEDKANVIKDSITKKLSDYELNYINGASGVPRHIALRLMMTEAGLFPSLEELEEVYRGLSDDEIAERYSADVMGMATRYGIVSEEPTWVATAKDGVVRMAYEVPEVKADELLSVGQLKEEAEKVKSGDFTKLIPESLSLDFLDQQALDTEAARSDRAVGLAKNKIPSTWLEDFESRDWEFKVAWNDELNPTEKNQFTSSMNVSGHEVVPIALTNYTTKAITINNDSDSRRLQKTIVHEFAHYASYQVGTKNIRNRTFLNRAFNDEAQKVKHVLGEYATYNEAEYIAEFVSSWITQPELQEQLSKFAPKSTEYTKRLINDYQELLQGELVAQ